MLEPRPANCGKKNQRLAELPPRLEALGVVSLRLFDPETPAAVKPWMRERVELEAVGAA